MNTITGRTRKLILNLPRLGCGDWWVEVTTSNLSCVYYFGPFPNCDEASEMCPDYILNLVAKGAENISTVIKRCHPAELIQWSED